MKFGILFILIISASCGTIPPFKDVSFCSKVRENVKCADYSLNSAAFIGEWSEALTNEEEYNLLQHAIIISREEFLLKLRPSLIKLRKYKKQKKRARRSSSSFDKVERTYEL